MKTDYRGFTLIETLLAMMILSTGLVLLSQSWGGAFSRIKKTQITTEMAALLQRKIVEVEMEYKNKPLDSIPEEKEDDFGSEYPNYSWKLESQDFAMPDISSAMTAREGGADLNSMNVIRQMTEHFSKSIKEVRVTVIYKGGKKPLAFSVTTYFIDYDRSLPFGGSGAADTNSEPKNPQGAGS